MMLVWRSVQETWCVALVCRCVCFCFSVCLLILLVILLFHSNTRFKWVVRQRLTRVFPFQSFETDTTRQSNFCGNIWYTVTRQPLLITQNGSKAVDLASTAVTAKEMCFIAWKTIMVIASSYVWTYCLNWKEYACNLHEKMHPRI